MAAVSRSETDQHDHERPQAQYRRQRGKLQHARNNGSVLSGIWIIVIAVQQYLIGQRADFVLRRLDQSQAQILGRVLDAVVVLRDLALWRQQRDGGGVRELSGFRIVLVLKSGGFRQRVNRFLRTGQKVPAIGGAGASITLQKFGLLLGGHLRRFAGI